MKKGQVYEGVIDKVEFPNKGIVSVEGEDKTVVVKNGIPGQNIKFCVNKMRKGKAEGRLLEVLQKSPLETREPVCSIFPDCGGCMYQTMSYEEQVKMKEAQVKEILDAAIVGDYEFEGVKASPKEFAYRNKMEFSFGDEVKDGPLSLGMHKRGSFYDVVAVENCQIVDEDYRTILKITLEFFKEKNLSFYIIKITFKKFFVHISITATDTSIPIQAPRDQVRTVQSIIMQNPKNHLAFCFPFDE